MRFAWAGRSIDDSVSLETTTMGSSVRCGCYCCHRRNPDLDPTEKEACRHGPTAPYSSCGGAYGLDVVAVAAGLDHWAIPRYRLIPWLETHENEAGTAGATMRSSKTGCW
jgi:hypothetical protein